MRRPSTMTASSDSTTRGSGLTSTPLNEQLETESSLLADDNAALNSTATRLNVARDRRIAVVCAVSTHCAIGGIYTFSLFTDALARNDGVVGKTSRDWNVSNVIPVFSLTICCAGLVAALTGSWAERVGPRLPIALSGIFWGGGLLVTALGLAMHSLIVVYLGYGVIGGCGIGLAYAPPVAALIRWYPTRKGFASGLAIMGFGGGALLASPLIRSLMNSFFDMPEVLGKCNDLKVETDGDGSQWAVMSGGERKRLVVPVSDLSSLGYSSNIINQLQNLGGKDACFGAGTGSTGAAGTFFVLGLLYLIVLVSAGWAYRVAPAGFKDEETGSGERQQQAQRRGFLPPNTYVLADKALRSRQFVGVWLDLFLNATAGIALLGVAKNIVYDVYSVALPETVDVAFCTTYVAVLSLFNGLGRIFWASVSDKLGRKLTFSVFFLIGGFIYITIPSLARNASGSASLPMFIVLTIVAVTIYGGGFAISPAYLSDLFGTKQVGVVYAKLLTAWSAAGLCGPTLLAYLRRKSEVSAIVALANQVRDTMAFSKRFGKDPAKVHELISKNAIDIPSLMELLRGEGQTDVLDPTPSVYDSTMYVMAVVLVVGLVNNWFVQPVSRELWTNDVLLTEGAMIDEEQQLLVGTEHSEQALAQLEGNLQSTESHVRIGQKAVEEKPRFTESN